MSVEQIADAVDFKAPWLYKHYRSKQDIFNAIFKETARRYGAFTDSISVHLGDSGQDSVTAPYHHLGKIEWEIGTKAGLSETNRRHDMKSKLTHFWNRLKADAKQDNMKRRELQSR